MNILKQSTAATIKLGPFIDDSDGKTAETGLTISQADIRLSKNGGDFAQKNNATGATHDEFGYYDIPLNTTDTGTLGRLRVAVSESGALPVWQDFLVVTANVYDTLCSTDKLDVAVVEMATDVLAAAAVKADAVTKIQNGLATPTNITAASGVELKSTQGAITWGQQKIVANVAGEGALDIVNSNSGGVGQHNKGGSNSAGLWNEGTIGTLNDAGSIGLVNSGSKAVVGFDSALATATNLAAVKSVADDILVDTGTTLDTLTDIKGSGWTNQTLAKIVTDISNISAGSGATPQQIWEYATRVLTAGTNIDLSSLATADNLAAVKSDTAAILADTGTDGVKINATQGAITWGQQKIVANVAGEGALDIENTSTGGLGGVGIRAEGELAGQYNAGSHAVWNDGISTGQRNNGGLQAVEGFDPALATATNLAALDGKVDTVDGVVDAIKAKSDLIPATPAQAGEYTAAIAAVQADLDNPDQYKADVSTLATTAGDVWSYAKRTLTHPSVSAEEPEDSNALILYRDADIAIELTDLTIPAGAKKYIFTIKDNLDSGDDQAVLQASYAIDGSEVETNTLVYINSAAAPVLTNPVTFTLTDTNITIDLTAEAAALLPRYERGYLNWDLKLVTDAAVTIVLQGLAQIIGTSTRAIE